MTDRRSGAPAAKTAGAAAILRGNLLTPAYLWVTRQNRWRALALAAGLGVFANLALPPIGVWPAMALALTGLVWLMDGARLTDRPGWSAFWRNFAFAGGYFLVGLHWVAAAFLVDPGAYLAFIWLAVLVLPGGLALVWAAVMRIGFHFWNPGPARLIVFGVALALEEWVRGHLFGGFPWNLPGMVWAPGGAISQTASIWGIYGLTLLTILALASPAALADARPRGTTASRAAPIVVAAIIFGGLWGWGAHRLDEAPKTTPGVTVRLITTGVSQAEKRDYETGPKVVRRFLELTGPDTPESPRIVIWPEGALPYYVFQTPDVLDAVTSWLGTRKLIFGTAFQREGKAYNSLAVLGSESARVGPLGVYDKHMLVPFGEFIPLREVMGLIGIPTLQDMSRDGFWPGAVPTSVRVNGVPPFGPLICYEAIFPGLSPAGVDRPRWLVTISDDSWFGNLSGPVQHAAQARYRAIEEGLPLARVAAGGYSGMIDAYGRWTVEAKPADPKVFGEDRDGWVSAVADADIPPPAEATPYSRWREGLFWLMLLAFNCGLFVLPRR